VTTNPSISTARRLAAAGAFSAVLALGVGTSGAQDLHSGGTSPNEETRDPGAPQTEVAGVSESRGGLPVTGSDVAGLTAVGAAAIAVGAGAVVASKRRTRVSA
jgi:LPXTG-motif cell wall-anchored protein